MINNVEVTRVLTCVSGEHCIKNLSFFSCNQAVIFCDINTAYPPSPSPYSRGAVASAKMLFSSFYATKSRVLDICEGNLASRNNEVIEDSRCTIGSIYCSLMHRGESNLATVQMSHPNVYVSSWRRTYIQSNILFWNKLYKCPIGQLLKCTDQYTDIGLA